MKERRRRERTEAVNDRFGPVGPGKTVRRHALVEEGGIISAHRPPALGSPRTPALGSPRTETPRAFRPRPS